MTDAFNTAEEELNFILGNDNTNDGSVVNDLFEDSAAVEDTMLFIDSPSHVKAKSSLNFAAEGEGGLVHDGTPSYGPAATTTEEEDEQKHTISRMVSLSPPPPSLPPSLTHHPSQAAAASSTDFASLYALNSLNDQNDIFDLLNNDPPVMSSLVPGSSNGVGGDLSYSHSENDPYKELLPVMNNNNSLLQQQLHNMLPRSLPSNTNIDKMLDTFKIEEGEYDSLNLLDTMLNVEHQMTAAATFQDLQDRLGQFHPVNNGGGGLGGLFGVVGGGGLPPLSPQYDDLLHSSSSTTKASSSSSSSITPDRLQGQVYVPIVHSVAHLPLPAPSRGGGKDTNTKKVGHNKRRPLRKRKVSMSDIAPEDVSELNLLQVEEPILDFFSNYTTDTSGLVPSVSVVGGGSRSSSSRKKLFGYRAPTIFHSHPRLKGLKPILPTGVEAIAARRARKVRRLARAKAQVVNLVGAEDVDDIVEDTISIITNVNVMATIEKCQEELVRDFTENLNVKVFVESVWENTEIKNKITEEVDVVAAVPVPKDSLEIKLPQDCPSSPRDSMKGSTTTTTCVTPDEKNTTVSSKAEKSGPSSADHLKLLPEGKDPESRRLRRLMRNRLSAQASRDRRKKVVDDLVKEKETKKNEIESLKQQVLEEQKRMMLLENAVAFALDNEKYSSAASIANSSNIIQSV